MNESLSDLTSGVPLRSPFPGDAATAAALASRFHWEQYQRLAALHQHGALTMQQGMGISPNGITREQSMQISNSKIASEHYKVPLIVLIDYSEVHSAWKPRGENALSKGEDTGHIPAIRLTHRGGKVIQGGGTCHSKCPELNQGT